MNLGPIHPGNSQIEAPPGKPGWVFHPIFTLLCSLVFPSLGLDKFVIRQIPAAPQT